MPYQKVVQQHHREGFDDNFDFKVKGQDIHKLILFITGKHTF